MRLATYTVTMTAVYGIASAILSYKDAPLSGCWLDGVVAPGMTLGGAVVLGGMWVAGVGSTAGGIVGLVWLAWDAWRHRQRVRCNPDARANDTASP
jgi:hypothetical protein